MLQHFGEPEALTCLEAAHTNNNDNDTDDDNTPCEHGTNVAVQLCDVCQAKTGRTSTTNPFDRYDADWYLPIQDVVAMPECQYNPVQMRKRMRIRMQSQIRMLMIMSCLMLNAEC